MQVLGLKDVIIGVGHLRRQVDFYTTMLGLRIQARGQMPPASCRSLWNIDEPVNMVLLRRNDLPSSLSLRLIPAFDLPARPDFEIRTPGPLGLMFGTEDIVRTYYRLSGSGVEFHHQPVEVGPGGPRRRRYARHLTFGRAYDGEYITLAQPAIGSLKDGTVSPYFGVTEPLELSFVVSDLEPSSRFLKDALGFESLICARRSGESRELAMGLAPGTSFTLETLRDRLSGLRLSLLCFGSHRIQSEIRPPARGINSLRFHCQDLHATLERCVKLGATDAGVPTALEDPVDGKGLGVALMTPLGAQMELWQTLEGA